MDKQQFIIRPCTGYTADLSDLIEIGKLLLKMGYKVNRTKVFLNGRKSPINGLIVIDEGSEKNDGN